MEHVEKRSKFAGGWREKLGRKCQAGNWSLFKDLKMIKIQKLY
jgi:hypothetical protein